MKRKFKRVKKGSVTNHGYELKMRSKRKKLKLLEFSRKHPKFQFKGVK